MLRRYAIPVAITALIVEAVVHVQQYVAIFRGLDPLGPLFLVNAAAAALVAALLTWRPSALVAAAGIAVSLGAIVGLGITFVTPLFGYKSPGLGMPELIAFASEGVAIVALVLLLATDHGREPSSA